MRVSRCNRAGRLTLKPQGGGGEGGGRHHPIFTEKEKRWNSLCFLLFKRPFYDEENAIWRSFIQLEFQINMNRHNSAMRRFFFLVW